MNHGCLDEGHQLECGLFARRSVKGSQKLYTGFLANKWTYSSCSLGGMDVPQLGRCAAGNAACTYVCHGCKLSFTLPPRNLHLMDLLGTTPVHVEFWPSPVCGHCKKSESQLPTNTKLKRCVGCSIALYCSKDCQKAAWPTHKYVLLLIERNTVNVSYSESTETSLQAAVSPLGPRST